MYYLIFKNGGILKIMLPGFTQGNQLSIHSNFKAPQSSKKNFFSYDEEPEK